MLTSLQRATLRIVATDSGLGGLSVVADLVERIKIMGVCQRAHVEFFNCLPAENCGFDAMTSSDRRHRVFSNVLESITRKFQPDAILIACNTLSVLYNQTVFARNAHVPVLGIVEIGNDLIRRQMVKQSDTQVLMFAAPTTVQSGIHKHGLVQAGIPARQLIYQDCRGLPSAIEEGVASPKTHGLIEHAVRTALKKIEPTRPVAAALLCTHFGFTRDLFAKALCDNTHTNPVILDPTPYMAEVFLKNTTLHSYARTTVTVAVSSHTRLSPAALRSIGDCLEQSSADTAAALRDYTYLPKLFNID